MRVQPHPRRFFPRVLMALVITSVLVAGITACSKRTPTPTPAVVMQETALPPSPTAQVPSTQTAQPTQTPVPLPPVVVDTRPAPGDEAPPDAPIEIVFSEPIDPASVRDAIEVFPHVPGDIKVSGATVRFQPRTPFPRETLVTVRVNEKVKAANGLPILRPVYYRYLTQAPLRVTQHSPRNKEIGVALNSPVQLSFNRPMVSLDRTNAPMAPPSWLRISPTVGGEVRWVGTSLLEFSPDPAFRAGTTYTVTVAPPLQSVDGAPLTTTVAFSFTTDVPRVAEITATYVDRRRNFIWPDKPITVTFNMPMDPASATDGVHFVAEPDQTPVPITQEWPDATTLVVRPRQPLSLGEAYSLILTDALHTQDGEARLSRPVVKTFRVVPPIRVVDTDPREGEKDVPPGQVGVTVNFEGLLDVSSLEGNIQVIPEPTSVFTYATHTRLWVRFPTEAQTAYTVILKGDVRDIFGNSLGKDVSIHFRTGDYRSSYRVSLPWGAATFEAGMPISLTMQGRNMEYVQLALYRPRLADVPVLATADQWTLNGYGSDQLGDLLHAWKEVFPPQRNVWHTLSVALKDAEDKPLSPGVYILDVAFVSGNPKIKPRHQRTFIVVTPYNVLLKTAPDNTLVWVTDLRTGQPVAGKQVAVVTSDESKLKMVYVETDANGLAQAPLKRQGPWQRVVALVNPDAPEGLAASDWQEGISPWDFKLSVDYDRPMNLVAYVQTERPVYRPGQTIHWKMIVRQDNDGVYELPPPGTEVSLQVYDANGDPLFEGPVSLNEMGTASGDIPLDENAPLGFYNVWVEGARAIGMPTILVAAYRKPEFEINVQAEPKEVVAGDSINVTATARYFFGAPVSNARVEYVVLDEPYYFSWECPQQPCPSYSFNDTNWWEWEPFRPTGEPLARGSGRTNEAGVFTLTLPATLREGQGSRRWKVEVTVYDVSGQVISGRTYVVVHKAAVYPGIATRSYVSRVNTPATADLILVDMDGRPIPNGTVTFVAMKETWHNVHKQDSDGIYRWVSEVEETPVYTQTVTLNAKGQGEVSFTPTDGGTYRLRVQAQDARGRVASASTFLWVSSSTYVSWRRENNNRLFLVADKKNYRVGEVAHVLVPTPYDTPVQALITLERGSIRKVWTTTLPSNSETIDIPITQDMAPNVFLSVFIVQGSQDAANGQPSFRLGYTELDVDVTPLSLAVRLQPEHEKYRPRDVARFTVGVEDSQGNPVDAEVALALVDKAVLSLFDRPTPMLQVFYRKRGLGVSTSASLVKQPTIQAARAEQGGKGGGGGGGGAAPTVREEFLDVAYWKPDVRTGPQGQAQIETPLPDNLTTWTLLAWAVDAKTRVGEASRDILVTQDFLLRPVLPRFFTRGDTADVGVVAHNLSNVTLRAQVTMKVTGATLVGDATQEVVLAPGQKEKLSWRVKDVVGAQGEGEPVFTAYWQGTTDVSGVGDAVRITLPVRYPVPADVVATAGTVAQDGSRVEVVALPSNRVPDMGELQLDLDASLASGMLDSLTYLRHYPWECSEQTVSRFLPNVATWQALKRLGVQNPELERVLPDLVATAVQRLTQQQNPDGGWGWWDKDESNPFLTAYALWALTQAEQAGFHVDTNVTLAAAQYLDRVLARFTPDERPWKNNRAAMAVFALSSYATTTDVVFPSLYPAAVKLFQQRAHLDNYGKALLGLAFGTFATEDVVSKAAQEASAEYMQNLLSELERSAILDPTGAHWEEKDVDWWNMNNDIRTTAIVLMLMARYDPKNDLAPNAVRWLMAARKGDRWTHTQDTAWSVVALTDWMAQTGELHPDYDYAAWLNGTVWLSGTMTPSDVGKTQTAVAPLTDLSPDKPNWVRIGRTHSGGQSGTGMLYYRLLLKTYEPLENLKPKSRGIVVERWYTVGDSDTHVEEAHVGDLVTVHLRVIVSRYLQYVMLEDPLPAGVEPVDVRLKTSTSQAEGPRTERKGGYSWWYWWWYWAPTHVDLRDDRAGFFQSGLSAGTYEITYQVRASIPGTFVVGPAVISQMYSPEVFGRTGATTFRVLPGEQ